MNIDELEAGSQRASATAENPWGGAESEQQGQARQSPVSTDRDGGSSPPTAAMFDYDAAYRQLNPRSSPYSPWEKTRELHDLWPCERAKFRRLVDGIRRL